MILFSSLIDYFTFICIKWQLNWAVFTHRIALFFLRFVRFLFYWPWQGKLDKEMVLFFFSCIWIIKINKGKKRQQIKEQDWISFVFLLLFLYVKMIAAEQCRVTTANKMLKRRKRSTHQAHELTKEKNREKTPTDSHREKWQNIYHFSIYLNIVVVIFAFNEHRKKVRKAAISCHCLSIANTKIWSKETTM